MRGKPLCDAAIAIIVLVAATATAAAAAIEIGRYMFTNIIRLMIIKKYFILITDQVAADRFYMRWKLIPRKI